MPNLSKAAMARIGRVLPGGEGARPLANLSQWSAVPRKSIMNWTLPSEDPQYRTMPPVAKRMLALLAYFSMTGQLTRQVLDNVQALEAAMADEKRSHLTARRVGEVMARVNERFAAAAAAEQTAIAPGATTAVTPHPAEPPADLSCAGARE